MSNKAAPAKPEEGLGLSKLNAGTSSNRDDSASPGRLVHTVESPKYHNLSSSVLRFSSPRAAKFPQAERFPPMKQSLSQSLSLPPIQKGSSIGESPTFDKYGLKSDFGAKNKGPSFGVPYSAYEKTYVPGSNEAHLPFTKHYPGPGAYNISKDPTAELSKVTLKPKGKMFNEGLGVGLPHCNQYSPKASLVLPSKYSKPSFGFGIKYDFTKPRNSNPGPGAYTPSSLGSKFGAREGADKI